MRTNRFFCSPITDDIVTLDPIESRHLVQVLRLQPGAQVELFDAQGAQAQAELTEANPKQARLHILDLQTHQRRSSGRIVLAVSVAKGERFDWLIGKATELGVDALWPVVFERTVKLAKNTKIVARYEKLALAAAKQSGRVFLPEIMPPQPFGPALEQVQAEYTQCRIMLGSLAREASVLTAVPWDGCDIVAFVGPEGGMTEQEEQTLIEHQTLPVRLTPTTLRIETAALAFAAVLAVQRAAESRV